MTMAWNVLPLPNHIGKIVLFVARLRNTNLVAQSERKGVKKMELFRRLIVEEDGQGLVEYTLIVLLVALVFWVGIRSTGVGDQLSTSWNSIKDCLSNPQTGCAAGGGGS